MNRKIITGTILVTGALLAGAACGGDENARPATTTSPAPAAPATTAGTPSTHDSADMATVVVNAVDHAYEDLPASVPVGTKLSLTNSAPTELHEIVVWRIPDGEERSVDEIMGLSEEERDAIFNARPALVMIVSPGDGEVYMPVGNGILSTPGRYAVIDMIPVGTDPAAYIAADKAAPGPPTGFDGQPHFSLGMVAELEVTP